MLVRLPLEKYFWAFWGVAAKILKEIRHLGLEYAKKHNFTCGAEVKSLIM